jgi:hypothetical protein
MDEHDRNLDSAAGKAEAAMRGSLKKSETWESIIQIRQGSAYGPLTRQPIGL